MQIFMWNLVALSVAVVYYTWREGHLRALHRQQLLRHRVAQMLWTAADRA